MRTTVFNPGRRFHSHLFTTRKARSGYQPRRARPRLEQLESRDCPAVVKWIDTMPGIDDGNRHNHDELRAVDLTG
jgi:hypothetical protein